MPPARRGAAPCGRCSDAAAARLVVVDAVASRTARFYRQHEFVDLPDNPLRLFRRVADIRKSLAHS